MAMELPDQRVLRVFARGEAFDSDGFADLFVDKPIYQFGNFPPAFDRHSIGVSVTAFFGLVDALYHDVKMVRTVGDTAFVEMDVHYWRKQGGLVILPCLDVFRFAADGRVIELRIGMDAAPVADASRETARDATVFVGVARSTLPHGHAMRRYFAESEDGRARASSHPPRWSLAGPQWPIGSI